MIDSKNKGLKFPKAEFKKKINLDTNSTIRNETGTVLETPEFDGFYGLQLDYIPYRKTEERGQTLADPVITCLDDSSTRIIDYYPTDEEPALGHVFLDIMTGTIQFNEDDAGKEFQVSYYPKFSLLDHNAMNRVWEAGVTYLVGDEPHHDASNLEDLLDLLEDGDSIKLLKDITTVGVEIDKVIRFDGNNRSITKSGTADNSRAISTSANIVCFDVNFEGWDETGDVCVFADGDIEAIITRNKNIGGTKLTNAYDVCTHSVVENNLPLTENVGQSIYVNEITLTDRVITTKVVSGSSVVAGQPITINSSDLAVAYAFSSYPQYNKLAGIATQNKAATEDLNICVSGLCDVFSGLKVGSEYFVTNLNNVKKESDFASNEWEIWSLGFAHTTTSILLNIQYAIKDTKLVSGNFSRGTPVVCQDDGTFISVGISYPGNMANGRPVGVSLGNLSGTSEVKFSGLVPLGITDDHGDGVRVVYGVCKIGQYINSKFMLLDISTDFDDAVIDLGTESFNSSGATGNLTDDLDLSLAKYVKRKTIKSVDYTISTFGKTGSPTGRKIKLEFLDADDNVLFTRAFDASYVATGTALTGTLTPSNIRGLPAKVKEYWNVDGGGTVNSLLSLTFNYE